MAIKYDYVLGKLRESDAGGGGGGTDANAVHVNAAGEIDGITAKGTPTTSDILLIEDAADSNNKKKITIGNLPSSGSASPLTTKGDLYSYGQADARLPVGTNGQILVADSNEATGLKWQGNAPAEPRIVSVTSTATLTVSSSTTDQSIITAQAEALTIAAPTGTPVEGQKLIIRLKDNGSARAITFNAIFRALGVTLPTTTVASKTTYLGLVYNSTDTKWDILATKTEA